MLGEVFAEGAADVGFWATCTKRSIISCAISVRAPMSQRVRSVSAYGTMSLRSRWSASMLNCFSHSPPRANNDISCNDVIACCWKV